jgi:hypothetical protein
MSSVGVVTQKKSKCFVREKKSKCPKKNFQNVEGRKKCKCRISGVRKKKKLREKKGSSCWGKKSKCFWVKIKVKVFFAKFVFTSWALCCGTWVKFEKFEVTGKRKLMRIFKVFFGSGLCLHKFGRYIVKHGKNLKLKIYVSGKI